MNLCGIDSISPVMSFSILHIGNEAFRFSQFFEDKFDNVDICHFSYGRRYCKLPLRCLYVDQVNGLAVILHIEPVPYVFPIPIHWKGLIFQSVHHHERYQLFRELVRSVVIAAAGNGSRQAVGTMVGAHQKIGSCLGAAVGRAGMKGRLFREEKIRSIQGQIPIYLVGGYLMVPADAILPAASIRTKYR